MSLIATNFNNGAIQSRLEKPHPQAFYASSLTSPCMLKYQVLVMEELPPNLGSNLPELAKELYRTGCDCLREGKFLQGIEALERSLATYQQLASKGPEDYLHERFQVWFNLGKC